MPRKPRYYHISSFYHVMVQGDEKKYIFSAEDCKKEYRYLMKHNAIRNSIELIAYCIMDNHVHMLLYCPQIESISKMMQQTNTSFGLSYNIRRDKVGHVFRERFRSECIYTKSHLINCIKYIHENPVKAGICEKCCDYQYSSFHEISKINPTLLQICDISNYELNRILTDTHTETKYIDDEVAENVNTVFEEIKNKMKIVKKDIKCISKIYYELKERCKISDACIANLLQINRSALLRMLKKQKQEELLFYVDQSNK